MKLNLQRLFLVGSLTVPLTFVASFTPAIRPSVSSTRSTSSTTTRLMLPSDILNDPAFVEHLNQLHQAPLDFLDSSQLLAAADAARVATEDTSWWQQYLNIFKGTLQLVHSTIDAPLKSAGIENTWGISIALFTASVRSLLLPLSVQQSKSSEYMKALKPYQADIREKFKGDEDTTNRALGKLMEDAKQNPLAGCFVSLAQLPVFLGLYRGVRLLALDGDLTEPFLWIPSLQGPVSGPDYRGLGWLTEGWQTAVDGGLPTPALGWETTIAFLIMPVVLVTLQAITMKTLQPPMDDTMGAEERETMEKSQGFLKFLPLMIGFFSLQVPAGLTIYWFTSNIFTLSQSLAVKAYFAANPPNIELPEYWDALEKDATFESMTPEERRTAAEAGLRVGPSFDDWITEAKFHCLIERPPLRDESAAWERAVSTKASIPAELEAWVKKLEPVRSEAAA